MIAAHLREATSYAIANNSVGLKQIDAMIEAANRIDALEASLRKISDRTDDPIGFCDCTFCLQTIARDALGESNA